MIVYLISIISLILFYQKSKKISLFLGLYKKGRDSDRTPITGGLGIYFFFLINLIYLIILENKILNTEFIIIIVTVSLIFFIGFIDDILNIDYKIRLLSIFVILFLFVYLNNNFLITFLYFEALSITLVLGATSYFLTPLFILILINSMNMADGINGNSGLIFITYSVILYFVGNISLENLILIIIPIIIFLIFNLNNKCYLGDSGVYLLSTIISFYIIKSYNLDSATFSSEKIFLLLMIPGLDMLRLFCVRILNKTNPFKGDINHLHHLLIRKFSNNKTLLIIMLLIIWPNLFYKILSIKIQFLIILNTLIYIFLIIYLTKLKNFSNQFKKNK